ncbi:MAG: hypothetical protein GY715_11445, partial [Planctomycetes bacterium]|nr:hypothetical protein [Planctomycetota bacterium]
NSLGKEDIFYYVYGILHSPEYRSRFAADLKKMLARLPLTKETADFRAFSKAGRDLAEWHLNYESVEPWPVVENDTVIGLVSIGDLNRAVQEVQQETIRYLEQYMSVP